jgi:hypothetical protein
MCGGGPVTVTDVLHLCASKSDCASDTVNPDCCLLNGSDVCISDGLAKGAGLTCL